MGVLFFLLIVHVYIVVVLHVLMMIKIYGCLDFLTDLLFCLFLLYYQNIYIFHFYLIFLSNLTQYPPKYAFLHHVNWLILLAILFLFLYFAMVLFLPMIYLFLEFLYIFCIIFIYPIITICCYYSSFSYSLYTSSCYF